MTKLASSEKVLGSDNDIASSFIAPLPRINRSGGPARATLDRWSSEKLADEIPPEVLDDLKGKVRNWNRGNPSSRASTSPKHWKYRVVRGESGGHLALIDAQTRKSLPPLPRLREWAEDIVQKIHHE